MILSFFFPWSITSSLLPLLQNDNVRNQRENVVLAIANAQSRLGIPIQPDPVSVLSADTYLSFCHSPFQVTVLVIIIILHIDLY
jgi:hypothetical protein